MPIQVIRANYGVAHGIVDQETRFKLEEIMIAYEQGERAKESWPKLAYDFENDIGLVNVGRLGKELQLSWLLYFLLIKFIFKEANEAVHLAHSSGPNELYMVDLRSIQPKTI